MTYLIVLKVIKFGEDRLNFFLNVQQKPCRGAFCPLTSLNRVKAQSSSWTVSSLFSAVSSELYLAFENPFVRRLLTLDVVH